MIRNLKSFLALLVLLGLPMMLFTCQSQVNKSSQRTNIVLIMADDLGFEALGCYGSQSYQTPNLDRLADEGIRFTHCYSNPLCTPSRVQIMTGKYNFRNYIGFGLLDPAEKTFGHIFRDAGYKTCVVGKWQLYGNERQRELAGGKIGSRPEEAGFEHYCLWQVENRQSRYKDPMVETSEDGEISYKGLYGPDVFLDYITHFIEQSKEEPFFIYFPMCLTHDPFQPTPSDDEFEAFDVAENLNDTSYFKNMTAYMDKIVGEITNTLDSKGLAENTLVIFTGDNGTDRDVISNWNGERIRGNKGYTNRFGTNVPLIAHWPGTIEKPAVNDALIDFTDILPTVLEAAGIEIPEEFMSDGVSFYPQLKGATHSARDWVFCHYDPRWGKFPSRRWVQDRQWKYYENGELYNVRNDPHENQPLNEDDFTDEIKAVRASFQEVLEKMQ